MPDSVVPTGIISRGASLARAGLHSARSRRSSDEVVQANARLHLIERLGRLRGLPQKVGQILSMSDDDQKASDFAPLTDAYQPVPFGTLRPRLEQSWNCEPQDIIQYVEETGHPASIGQVHRAILNDGRMVAIKIQYPGIRDAINADLKLLGWISAPVGDLRKGFDLAEYQDVIRQALDEELDYRHEAQNQRAYATAISTPGVVVPQIIDEHSTEHVLMSTWEDGATLDEARTWPQADRQAIATRLVQLFFESVFAGGMIHADPHAGNYRFRAHDGHPGVVLYDYGCVRRVCNDERLALLRLIRDTHHDSTADPYPLFVKLGFAPATLESVRHKLPAMCRILFEPFASPAKFDVSTWNRGERISDVLGDDRWNFRISGPASLIFLMRAFHGLMYYLHRLETPVSWERALAPHLAANDVAMDAMTLPVPTSEASSFAMLARHLNIRVQQNGQTRVKLSLPAAAIDDLDDVMPEDVRRRVAERGIAIPELVSQARQNQYRPQAVFRLDEDDDGKSVDVWLE